MLAMRSVWKGGESVWVFVECVGRRNRRPPNYFTALSAARAQQELLTRNTGTVQAPRTIQAATFPEYTRAVFIQVLSRGVHDAHESMENTMNKRFLSVALMSASCFFASLNLVRKMAWSSLLP